MNPDDLLRAVIVLPVLWFSLSVHEAAHAISARWGGDLTADSQGRVTLNPLSHIDPVGTLLIPILGVFTSIPLIGWAKPVPVVDTNYTRGKSYGVVVAMAGPFSNLLIALFSVVLGMFYGLAYTGLASMGFVIPDSTHQVIANLIQMLILINLSLMFFNLIPIPPLDGSWLVWYWFARGHSAREDVFLTVRQYGGFALLGLLWTGVLGIYLSAVNSLITHPILEYLYSYWERLS